MSSSKSITWLNRFAWFVAAATLLLIGSGGLVTSKGVGLAVPDWPTTFGYNMFLFPFSKWVGGIFYEHTHRLIASTIGFLTIILAVWIWRVDSRRWLRVLGIVAIAAVSLQGVLGGLRVKMLKDEIGIFHACLAQAFLGLLIVIGLSTSPRWKALTPLASGEVVRRIVRFAVVTAVIVYAQLALGATMRHQHRDLAILDFPTANGQWLPDTSAPAIAKINAWRDTQALSDVNAFQIWLQMVHRLGAVLIATLAVALWLTVRKEKKRDLVLQTLSNFLIALVLCQIALGAWTIWSNKAADVATMHVTVGATIFGLTIAICAISLRLRHLESSVKPAGSVASVAVAVPLS